MLLQRVCSEVAMSQVYSLKRFSTVHTPTPPSLQSEQKAASPPAASPYPPPTDAPPPPLRDKLYYDFHLKNHFCLFFHSI